MKKIIEGRLYNTETATKIAEWDNGCPRNDFSWCEEELYKKKTGEFFVYGKGGSMTYYSSYGCRCAGENIRPLTEEEAKMWVERKSDADTYIELWGEPDE